jgi:hypothetical protein
MTVYSFAEKIQDSVSSCTVGVCSVYYSSVHRFASNVLLTESSNWVAYCSHTARSEAAASSEAKSTMCAQRYKSVGQTAFAKIVRVPVQVSSFCFGSSAHNLLMYTRSGIHSNKNEGVKAGIFMKWYSSNNNIISSSHSHAAQQRTAAQYYRCLLQLS